MGSREMEKGAASAAGAAPASKNTEPHNDPWRLLSLEPNWDSYGAGPLRRDVVEMMVAVGQALSPIFGQASHVPCGDADGTAGQVEWHEVGWNVEVWIERRLPTSSTPPEPSGGGDPLEGSAVGRLVGGDEP